MKQLDGALYAARYSFRPNFLKYCGPDKNDELFQYLKAGENDGGLQEILKKFETLYPYLKLIAKANREENPFDKKIIESYWLGNDFLANVAPGKLFYHLADGLELKKKLPAEYIRAIGEKMAKGANPHHSFHVFNIWKRTGFTESPHTLFTMDECRIGWGRVQAVLGNIITVLYKPIIYNNGRLEFGALTAKNIFYELKDQKVLPSDWISFHWSSFCEVLPPEQLENLKKWTTINLELANYERK